ncbi:UPF0149 family protein [Dongshaea marina]|uniref:UPF0149 family protein n=1 Tax=Dongshaea marina TaxID=2047966 RepID=UPI000D3E4DC9|nr:UPF0149 family protein [Dongshaea marina]
MSTNKCPSYTDVAELFEQQELMTSPTEVHGLLTGFVAGGVSLKDRSWLGELDDLLNDGNPLAESCSETLERLTRCICEQLTERDGLFELMMPKSELPLDERLEYLSEWAQAFLVGLGLMQQKLNQASEELQEMIQDISSITQVSLDFEQEDESGEEAFMVLYEHLRLGVLMTFEEYGACNGGESSRVTLH